MGFKTEKLTFRLRPLPAETSMKDIPLLLATWMGSGRVRPASGTWGTLAAVPFGLAIMAIGGPLALAAAALLILWIGTWAAQWYGKKSGVVDDQAIVIDEVAGLWIAAIPAELSVELWIYAFIAFRLFDIFKPWPASFFDKRSQSGFDVMMDDVVAGIYAFILVAAAAVQTRTL